VRREYTPEVESTRDDAVAVLNACAVVVAVTGVWTKPILLGMVALAVAVIAYFLQPHSKGRTIVAVILVTIIGMLLRWAFGYTVA
jgi:hypothetical protein